jgi:hypothetical protein
VTRASGHPDDAVRQPDHQRRGPSSALLHRAASARSSSGAAARVFTSLPANCLLSIPSNGRQDRTSSLLARGTGGAHHRPPRVPPAFSPSLPLNAAPHNQNPASKAPLPDPHPRPKPAKGPGPGQERRRRRGRLWRRHHLLQKGAAQSVRTADVAGPKRDLGGCDAAGARQMAGDLRAAKYGHGATVGLLML